MGKLDIHSLTKEFNDGDNEIVAVDDLSLTVEDGEFLVLVGPSGCGKSTTLRCIAGLETTTEGEITLDGETVTHEEPKTRDMAMVFQDYALYPHMTARENMSFGLKMASDLSKQEISGRVEEAAEMMGILDLLDDRPGELSGGQQQRVALGRAIVREPEVFLMDEPLSNLDAKLRTHMRTELQRIQDQLGVTTIYVTHDQTESMTMGDRIAVLDNGEIQQVAAPEVCYDEPANKFVAGFIGSPSMNFFDVTVSQLDKGISIESNNFSVILERILLPEGEYTFGIRPEDLFYTEDEGRLQAEVDVVEPMGSDNFLYLLLDDGLTFTARVASDLRPSEGDIVNITFDIDDIHFFDESGDRDEPELQADTIL